MTKATIVAVVFGLVGGVTALAQAPGFSGAWVLDSERSVLHETGTRDIELTIADGGATVDVVQRIRRGEMRFSCTTDRKPCENITLAHDVYSRRLRREKGALLWEITMTRAADKASISYTERWSLSDEGKILTVHRVYPNGREVMQVFGRKRS